MAAKQHYPGLDGVRGVAALAVMATHEIGIFRPGIGPAIHAFTAVDLFFMLSGFVMAYAYDGRLDRGMSWGQFMATRLIRLYPLIFLTILLSAALTYGKLQHASASQGEPLAWLPAAFLLLPVGPFTGSTSWFSSSQGLIPFVGPGWSLFFELAGCAAFATRLRRPRKRQGAMLLLLAAFALVALVFLAGDIGLLGRQGYIGAPAGFLRFSVPFAIGVLLFRRDLPNLFGRVPIGVTIALTFTLLLLPIGDAPAFDLLCVFILFPIIVCLSAQGSSYDLVNRACLFLGKLSYPVYLLHVPVSRIMGFIMKGLHPAVTPNMLIFVSMLGSCIASLLALYFFDEPVRQWLMKRLKHRESQREVVFS